MSIFTKLYRKAFPDNIRCYNWACNSCKKCKNGDKHICLVWTPVRWMLELMIKVIIKRRWTPSDPSAEASGFIITLVISTVCDILGATHGIMPRENDEWTILLNNSEIYCTKRSKKWWMDIINATTLQITAA